MTDTRYNDQLPALAYSVKTAVSATGFSQARIYRLLSAGKIEGRKEGKRTVIPADSLRAYLNSLPKFTSTAKVAA